MYYEVFQKLCEEKGVKPGTVSKATGVPTSTLTAWKQGKYTPKNDKLQKIADYFDVPLDYITGGRKEGRRNIIRVYHAKDSNASKERYRINVLDMFAGKEPIRITKRIPVLGRVAAGIPIEATEEIIDWEEISGEMALDGDYFGLVIKGNSMEPKFSNGDVVIVRQQQDADDGDIVIALINGSDAVCKRLRKYQDGIALVSTNPEYEPMYFSAADMEDVPVRIIGKVKELRAKF